MFCFCFFGVEVEAEERKRKWKRRRAIVEKTERPKNDSLPLSPSLSLSLRDTDAPRKTRTWLGQLTTVSWKACGAAMSFLG
jgi:hypothetical protein